jgi:hypothetical protein
MVQTAYTAFGLALESSFELPGMAPAGADGLPSVALDLETPGEMQAAWSGGITASPWRGRLGDGEEFTIEWGTHGDLLFTYGERACFRLAAGRDHLGCAPKDVSSLDWQRVLLTRVLPNVSQAHGREALHASVVETPLGVVAVAAPSGMGKSTLASELVQRGWPLFADDVLTLSPGAEAVVAHPGSPHMNLASESVGAARPEELGTVLGTLAGERWTAVHGASREARRVAAVVLLERAPGLSLEAEVLSASPLVLAPYMLGLPGGFGHKATRFALYSDLAESAVLLRLTADPEDPPSVLAETLERALDLKAPLALGGVA